MSKDTLREIHERFERVFRFPAACSRLPGETSSFLFMTISPLIFAGWELVTPIEPCFAKLS
jgi:hypothetical protein